MSQNVKFYIGTLAKYNALAEKNPLALYFLEDVQQLYKGDKLYATGALATEMAAGLMSPEDRAKLDALTVNGVNGLTPVDGTISITDTADGGKAIGVALSAVDGNMLVAVEDGLFVPQPVLPDVEVPEYTIERMVEANAGFAATYKLKKTVGETTEYVGDPIDIAKDMVLESATLETVVEDGVPYDGATIGDPYIKMSFNDANATSLYVPVKGLVDTFKAGEGVIIVDNTISVKIAESAHGLVFVDGAMSINLATAENDGAMSKEDKAFIDSIPTVFATKNLVTGTTERVKYEITSRPVGSIVKYDDHEIRLMCAADTEWTKQNSGENANANMYYVGIKAYAPNNAVNFREDVAEKITDETVFSFENNEFAGTDEFGRKYSIVWLPVAIFDEATSSWTYYGASSSEGKYVGWFYSVEWLDENGVVIDADTIRINMSNENCHTSIKPYYMDEYVTADRIAELEDSYTWGEME